MINIIEINENLLKSKITEEILRKLPEWFGIEEALLEYIDTVKDKKFYAAYDEKKAIGFICLKLNNQYTADIHVIGILKEYHNKGIGKKLIKISEDYLNKNQYKFFMLKTLSNSSPDINYKKTRKFYEKIGFYPLEEFTEIWDKHNPCLIMVKSLENLRQ